MDEEPTDNGRARVPDGVFWADHIRTLKDDPLPRLAVARQYLPFPAAFREAAVALRALIRARRKANDGAEDLLADLYRIAAQSSFLLDTPYIEGLGTGFNVAESIPRSTWEALDMPFRSIGYGKLVLLNKSDRKWLIEAWGEPEQHVSAQVFHRALWESAVATCRAEVAKREREFERDVRALVRGGGVRDEDDGPRIRHFHTKAAGVTMQNPDGGDRQSILKSCRTGEHVSLVHDPRNPHDANAIEIRRANGQQVGFMPAHVAESMVEDLGLGIRHFAWIAQVTGGEDDKYRGANLLIVCAEPGPSDGEIDAYARERLGAEVATRRGGCASALLLAVLMSIVVIAVGA